MSFKKVALIVLALCILYVAFPLVWLVSDVTTDSMVAEFAYRRIADRFDTPEELNAWIYVNEEQNLSWMTIEEDAIDKNCLFDLVRGIGWCDQKSFLLTKLLAIKGISARCILFPCHTFVESNGTYYDPAFNKTEYYSGDCIKGVTPRFSNYNITVVTHFINVIYRIYPKEYIDLWLDIYVARLSTLDLSKVATISDYYRTLYSDPDYLPLYKARLYHIYGLYDKVNYSVSSKFYEEACFYSMALDLDMGNPVNEYLELDHAEKGYLSMIEPYFKRYHEVYK